MMAMSGWRGHKMPAHYIAKANFMPLRAVNATVTPISNIWKNSNDFNAKCGAARSEGGLLS
jgi:hypothetical protein